MKEAEKVTPLSNIEITFEPAKVAFSDFEAFEEGIEQAIAQYGTFDLGVNTIEEVKKARTDLNKLSKSLEDRRKEIKGAINQPYSEFEKLYKTPYSKLKGLIDELKNQIDGYEENQKELRKDTVRAWFKQKAEEGNLNPEIFEPYLEGFTKGTQFKKDTFTLLKKTETELEAIVMDELQKQNQKDQDMMVITGQCAANNLGPVTYIRAYESGLTLAEVLNDINKDVEASNLAKQQQEAKAKAEAERQAEIERQAKENAQAQIKAYNADTGEIIENGTNTHEQEENGVQAKLEVNKDEYVTTIKFWFDLDQANAFKEWLDTNGIKFETVEGMKKSKWNKINTMYRGNLIQEMGS